MSTSSGFTKHLRRLRDELLSARICLRAGFIQLESPARLGGVARALSAYGAPGALVPIGALRYPNRDVLVDELGAVTYRQLDERTDAIAQHWRDRGVQPGDGIAILARNHRGFFYAFYAALKLGARTILLNTDFAGPQLRDAVASEGVQLLVHDEEFSPLVEGLELPHGFYLAWTETTAQENSLAAVISHAAPRHFTPPTRHATWVILTSGTTGKPKGANRGATKSLTPMGGLLGAIPMRKESEVTLVTAPVFHSLGFSATVLTMATGGTMVLRRKFDPAGALSDIETHRVTTIFLVPIMLQRLLDANNASERTHDLSSLRIVLSGGSQLGAPLAKRALDQLGDVIYNLYGSTEVALATIAGPEHLRRSPDTVGPPTIGSTVRVVDDIGKDAPPGVTGRIFVGNTIPFEGYTSGGKGNKDLVDGLVPSGDVGHFDRTGLLFIDGRDDAMIVSGGENVFPDEVEELLAGHEHIDQVAAIGVSDDQWGQRLRVFVVPRAGADLTDNDVRDYVRERLARFKVPRDVLFVDDLPRTPTGKLLKRQLPTGL